MASCEAVSMDAAPKAMGKGVGKAGKMLPPPKGLGKGLPPPKAGIPPLPRGLQQRQPSPEELGPKLRPLFWTAVQQVPPNSVWSDLVTPAAFDKEELERLFALTDLRLGASGKGSSSSRASSEEPRKRLRVLDDRTSQLLAIAFSKLPPPDQLAVMVDKFENFPDGLTPEAVIALQNAVNEHKDAVDQIRQVAVSQEAIAQLDMPEKFLLRLTTVPYCMAKLTCGALLVGQARELPELRTSVKEVGVCCQMIRKSDLLRKCMSTSLAVGNVLNRGTARSGVRGVVLPDSLLKLDELRGNSDATGESGDRNTSSVLDFVAQALVNENNTDLQKEAELLLSKARFASGISLEEAEANFRQVNAEAKKTVQCLNEIPESLGKTQIAARVNSVCEEVAFAVDLAQKVKAELTKTQQWSCCKGQQKSDDWFASWVQFFEIFSRALGRAQELRCRLRDEEKKRALLEEKKKVAMQSEKKHIAALGTDAARTPFCNVNLVEMPMQPKKSGAVGASSRAGSVGRKGGCILDDEAKLDLKDVDLAQLISRAVGSLDKENSSR